MMMVVMNIKKLFLSVCIFIAGTFAFSIPGVKSKIADKSGEYIFYRDLSFKTPAVIGFVFYDDSTYAIRFYSSEEKKDITLYISINPKNKALEFTGETINGMVSQDDSDIVNYLHDLFYEFTERRQKAELKNYGSKTVQENFTQFGGNVSIKYNTLVPVFNIESIVSYDGKPLFSLITHGCLTSSSDTSFTDFNGFDSGLPKDKKRVFKLESAKKFKASFEKINFELDGNWQQGMENLWLLGENALITVVSLQVPQEFSSEDFINSMTRTLACGTAGSYLLWEQLNIKQSDESVKIQSVFFQSDFNNVTRDFQFLKVSGDGKTYLFKLTVFDGVYQQNKKYFDSIVKSCRIK